jgi:hypothetical protein
MNAAHRSDTESRPLQLPLVPGVPTLRYKLRRLGRAINRTGWYSWVVAVIGGVAAILLAAYLFGIG